MHQSDDLIYLSRKKEILLNNHLINLLAFALLDLRLLTEILTQAREVKDEGVELDECKIIRQDFLLPSWGQQDLWKWLCHNRFWDQWSTVLIQSWAVFIFGQLWVLETRDWRKEAGNGILKICASNLENDSQSNRRNLLAHQPLWTCFFSLVSLSSQITPL